MADLGWFHEQRVELVDGEVALRFDLSPPHVACTLLALDILRTAFGVGYCFRVQMPLNLGEYTELAQLPQLDGEITIF